MNIFTYLTPMTYWVSIILWFFILGFYIKRLRSKEVKGRLISVLIIILAIDAFRTLFESFYFGAWYTALAGFLPKSIHTFLIRPEMVFVPKIFNVIAAIIVIALLIYKWLPKEESEKIAIDELIKKKTKALKKSEQKYQDLYNNAPDMYVSVDAKTSLILECNQTLATQLGYTKNEIISRPIFDMYHPDSLNEAKKAFQSFVSTGKIDNAELGLKTKKGRKIDVNLNATAVQDEKGNILYSRSAWRDITDRKKAEELKNRILESSIGGIYIYDLNLGGNTYINRQYSTLTGYTFTALSSMTRDEFASLFHPDDQEKVFEHMRVVVEELPDNSNLQIDYRFKCAKGGWKWFRSCDAVYERDENRKVLKFIGTFIDITEQKRLENEIMQSHKMEAIGTLAGGIAHDFNNILGIILGNAELAMDDVPEWNPASQNLDEVKKACMRAKDVVRQILSFSRKSEVEQKPLNLAPVVTESLKLSRASIPASIEIRQHANDVDNILGDPTQIHQIMINLCTNAAHAMEKDGGIFEVTLENTDVDEDTASQYPDLNPGPHVLLQVSDTGDGINDEVIDRVFDPYFTTKKVGKGTGMGLAVVHGIVKSHRGTISVESETERGTTFKLLFPAVKENVRNEQKEAQELPSGNERILFVDDEESMVNLNQQRLERLGYKVIPKTDPSEALEYFHTNPDQIDLVITDMTMPKMTGDGLAQEILKIRPDMPIILCTGYSDKISRESAQEFGIRKYIEKPIEKETLARSVREVLDGK